MTDMTGWQIAGALIQLIGSGVAFAGLGLLACELRHVFRRVLTLGSGSRDAHVGGATATAKAEAHAAGVVTSGLTGSTEEKLRQIEGILYGVQVDLGRLNDKATLASQHADKLEEQIRDAAVSAADYTDRQLQSRDDLAETTAARDVAIAAVGVAITVAGQIVALIPM